MTSHASSPNSKKSLHSRPVLFEHGLLPIPNSMPSVEQLCDMVSRGGEGRLTITAWHKIAKESFKMDTGYAQLVFEIFFDCLDGQQHAEGGGGRSEGGAEGNDVDATEFAIYLFVLGSYRDEALMGGTPRSLRADIAYPNLMRSPSSEKDPGPGSPRSSPLSPRTVAAGTKSMDMERRHINFLHKHTADILSICAGSMNAPRVTPNQFDKLGVVIMGAEGAVQLSGLVPSWRGGGATYPLSLSELNAWIVDSLVPPEIGRHGNVSPPKPYLAGDVSPTPMMLDAQNNSGHFTEKNGSMVLAGFNKSTLIRTAQELVPQAGGGNKTDLTMKIDMRLQNCNESFIYLSAPLRRVTVTGCSHCTVFVAACSVLTLENCERVKVISGCRRVRIANSVDSTLHLLTGRQPLLLGENHDLVLAPFNALASDCLQWWPKMGIDRTKNRWCEPLSLAKGLYGVALSGGAVAGQSLMPPESFFCITIPSNNPLPSSIVAAQANPCPLPPAYAAALQQKHKQVLDLRKEIAETEMSSAAPKAALQRAIQAKFKEWLVTSGALRQVQDLVHLDQLHGNGTESQRAFPFE